MKWYLLFVVSISQYIQSAQVATSSTLAKERTLKAAALEVVLANIKQGLYSQQQLQKVPHTLLADVTLRILAPFELEETDVIQRPGYNSELVAHVGEKKYVIFEDARLSKYPDYFSIIDLETHKTLKTYELPKQYQRFFVTKGFPFIFLTSYTDAPIKLLDLATLQDLGVFPGTEKGAFLAVSQDAFSVPPYVTYAVIGLSDGTIGFYNTQTKEQIVNFDALPHLGKATASGGFWNNRRYVMAYKKIMAGWQLHKQLYKNKKPILVAQKKWERPLELQGNIREIHFQEASSRIVCITDKHDLAILHYGQNNEIPICQYIFSCVNAEMVEKPFVENVAVYMADQSTIAVRNPQGGLTLYQIDPTNNTVAGTTILQMNNHQLSFLETLKQSLLVGDNLGHCSILDSKTGQLLGIKRFGDNNKQLPAPIKGIAFGSEKIFVNLVGDDDVPGCISILDGFVVDRFFNVEHTHLVKALLAFQKLNKTNSPSTETKLDELPFTLRRRLEILKEQRKKMNLHCLVIKMATKKNKK